MIFSLDNITYCDEIDLGNNTVFQHAGLVPGERYYYKVKAYNNKVESAYAGPAEAVTDP